MSVQIRQSLTYTAEQRAHLRAIIDQDAEAQIHWRRLKQQADALLPLVPRPLETIHFEGLLNTHPDRIVTTRHLEDMDHLALLIDACAASGSAVYAQAVREMVLAWASTYRPTGNAINDNKMDAVIAGYDLLAPDWQPADQRSIEDWMVRMAHLGIESVQDRPNTANNNWHTKRLNLIGTVGVICRQPDLIAYALAGYPDYLANGLFSDGTSVDFHRRDALHYHQSGLKPLVVLARFMKREGLQLWDLAAENGASVRRSIDWMIPYVDGTCQHAEWVNTQSTLDRQRAAAGIAFYETGKPYDPQNALELFELATHFDRKYLEIVRKITGSSAIRYPTWQTVAAAAGTGGDEWA